MKSVEVRLGAFRIGPYLAGMSASPPIPFIAPYEDPRLLGFFSFEALARRVPNTPVTVARSLFGNEDAEIGFREYLAYVQSCPSSQEGPERPWYLLRWNARVATEGLSLLWLPDFYKFDLLNALPGHSPRFPDYAKEWLFVGPAGSAAEFHFDHHFVHTILAQCEGTKRVRLIPDDSWRAIEQGGTRENRCRWSGFEDSQEYSCEVYECELKKGEFLFIPAGWYHSVRNLEPSVTYSRDLVDFRNYLRWFHEAIKDEVYRDFLSDRSLVNNLSAT